MSDHSEQNGVVTNPETTLGVLGDGAERPGKYNMRLAQRAIREDWPIPADIRASLVEQMAKVVKKGRSNRDKIGAARVLVTADTVNAKREALDQAAEHHADGVRNPLMPSVNLNVGISSAAHVTFYLPDNGRDQKAQ